VNNSGTVDSVDASLVLAHYARISTNKEDSFTDAQKSAGDVNKDGQVNSIDASLILAYYAYISTAKDEVSDIAEFVKNRS
jgi:acyl-homoserine lactone acylase PvdQ